jgi:hypothetical protein
MSVRSTLVAGHGRFGTDVGARRPPPAGRSVAHVPRRVITDAEHSFAAYGSSWIDSGVDQLGMLMRFVHLTERGALHETAGDASAWCTVRHESRGTPGTALLATSWQAVASSKRTTLRLGRSRTEIWLDHTAVTALVIRDDEVVEALTNDGRIPRTLAHYRPLYRSLLSPAPDPVLGFDAAARVTELLHGR